jgi:hypothetical protein
LIEVGLERGCPSKSAKYEMEDGVLWRKLSMEKGTIADVHRSKATQSSTPSRTAWTGGFCKGRERCMSITGLQALLHRG